MGVLESAKLAVLREDYIRPQGSSAAVLSPLYRLASLLLPRCPPPEGTELGHLGREERDEPNDQPHGERP